MLERVFYELAEDIGRIATVAEGDRFLQRMASKYELNHVAYLGVNLPVRNHPDNYYVATTYSPRWLSRYTSENYVSIDPIVRLGMQRVSPLDWQDIDKSQRPLRGFFDDAKQSGLAANGITIPVRGIHGETALFSINADVPDRIWPAYKISNIRDFQVLACSFHEHVLRREKVLPPNIQLSPKQLEVLKWAATGKTEWEVGAILNVSTRTVKYHMAGAFARLGTPNKVSAVARAVRLHLI
jgi:DNA-binding CsgD family transcriptional regulator